MWSFLFSFFKKFIYFQSEGKGRRKRGREIAMCGCLMCILLGTWSTIQAYALTGNRTRDPLVHRLALNPLSHTSQGSFFSFLSFFLFFFFFLQHVFYDWLLTHRMFFWFSSVSHYVLNMNRSVSPRLVFGAWAGVESRVYFLRYWAPLGGLWWWANWSVTGAGCFPGWLWLVFLAPFTLALQGFSCQAAQFPWQL